MRRALITATDAVGGVFCVEDRDRHSLLDNANYRQWHWRVAGEQLIFSHLDTEIHGDETSPLRYTKNTVRTLLVAGGMDNYESEKGERGLVLYFDISH